MMCLSYKQISFSTISKIDDDFIQNIYRSIYMRRVILNETIQQMMRYFLEFLFNKFFDQKLDQDFDFIIIYFNNQMSKKVVAKQVIQDSSQQSNQQVVPQKKVVEKKKPQAVIQLPKKVVKKPETSQEQSEQEPVIIKKIKTQTKVTKVPIQKAQLPIKKSSNAKQTKKVVQQQESDEVEQPVVKKPKAKVAQKKKPVKQPSSEQEVEENEKQQKKPQIKSTKIVSQEEKGEFEIYVGQLAYSVGQSQVQQLFEQFGEVSSVRVLKQPDGRSRGIAFVKFTTQSARTAACELNGSEQFGRNIKVEQSAGKPNPKNNNGYGNNNTQFPKKQIPENIQSTTVFVGNLSFKSNKQSLESHFSKCGQLKQARIAMSKQTGESRGFGYVEFYDVDSVKNALNLKGSNLDGRNINVDVASVRKNDGGSNQRGGRGGFGGGSRGYGGGYGGGFGGNNRSTSVALNEDDKNAKKGSIGTFKGTVKRFE